MRCKCGLKEVPRSLDFSWFWETHNGVQCTQLPRLTTTTPPPFGFSSFETIYRMKNCTTVHRLGSDSHDHKIAYHTGDTVYFNPDGTVKYVVDSMGRAWW